MYVIWLINLFLLNILKNFFKENLRQAVFANGVAISDSSAIRVKFEIKFFASFKKDAKNM
jgi:hypothetical protein